MLRREEFAVSLRRQRKKQIIESKRKRLPQSMQFYNAQSNPPFQGESVSTLQLDQQMQSQGEEKKWTEDPRLAQFQADLAELESSLHYEAMDQLSPEDKHSLIMEKLETVFAASDSHEVERLLKATAAYIYSIQVQIDIEIGEFLTTQTPMVGFIARLLTFCQYRSDDAAVKLKVSRSLSS